MVQITKLGHERWVPGNTPVISKTPRGRGKPKSQGSMCVVWIAQLGATRVKSLGSHKFPLGLGFPREAACMAHE